MKIVKDRTFKAKVTVEFPAEDGSEIQSFTGHFKALSMPELISLIEGKEDPSETFPKFLIGWDGLTDDREGKDDPFPFSLENVQLLAGDVFVARAIQQAYVAAISGAKRGN